MVDATLVMNGATNAEPITQSSVDVWGEGNHGMDEPQIYAPPQQFYQPEIINKVLFCNPYSEFASDFGGVAHPDLIHAISRLGHCQDALEIRIQYDCMDEEPEHPLYSKYLSVVWQAGEGGVKEIPIKIKQNAVYRKPRIVQARIEPPLGDVTVDARFEFATIVIVSRAQASPPLLEKIIAHQRNSEQAVYTVEPVQVLPKTKSMRKASPYSPAKALRGQG